MERRREEKWHVKSSGKDNRKAMGKEKGRKENSLGKSLMVWSGETTWNLHECIVLLKARQRRKGEKGPTRLVKKSRYCYYMFLLKMLSISSLMSGLYCSSPLPHGNMAHPSNCSSPATRTPSLSQLCIIPWP